MAQHTIPITNGSGSLSLLDGTYAVTSDTNGFDNSSILPVNVEIESGTDEYSFTISATGTLTIHVTDDGTEEGVPIVGAKFFRCDAEGNQYGDEIVSSSDGDAVFEHVPYAENDAPNIYYIQTASDGEHTFTDTLQTITLTEETATIQLENAEAAERTIKLTDANYNGLPIEDGNVILEETE